MSVTSQRVVLWVVPVSSCILVNVLVGWFAVVYKNLEDGEHMWNGARVFLNKVEIWMQRS